MIGGGSFGGGEGSSQMHHKASRIVMGTGYSYLNAEREYMCGGTWRAQQYPGLAICCIIQNIGPSRDQRCSCAAVLKSSHVLCIIACAAPRSLAPVYQCINQDARSLGEDQPLPMQTFLLLVDDPFGKFVTIFLLRRRSPLARPRLECLEARRRDIRLTG